MVSPHSDLASDLGSAAVPQHDGLAGWQRFLQSEPIGPVRSSGHQNAYVWDIVESEPDLAASIWELLATTLQGLTATWLVGALAATGATGSLVGWAFHNLAAVPPAPDCSTLDQQASTRSRLTCLQTAIAAGNPSARAEGLAWIGQWQPSEPLFNEGQEWLNRWSDSALHDAQAAARAEDWRTAIVLTAQIPASSPRFSEAQRLLQHLKEHQQAIAQRLDNEAQTALQQSDWATAYRLLWQLEALSHTAAPLPQLTSLAQQIKAERQAIRLWNEAQSFWKTGALKQRATAIARASEMSSETYRWRQIQPTVNQWSDELWPIFQQRLSGDNWSDALTMIQQISQNPGRAKQWRPWLQLARARQLAALSTADKPPPLSQFVGVSAALIAAQSAPLDDTLSANDSIRVHQMAIALFFDRPSSALTAATTAENCLVFANHSSMQPTPGKTPQSLQRLFPEQNCTPHFGR
ncbi:MAG: hypothetical protein ACFB0E_20005 [Leptolyngbyaceae cyanobacterium]